MLAIQQSTVRGPLLIVSYHHACQCCLL